VTNGANFAQHSNTEDQEGTMLAQKAKKDKSHITCFRCNEQGHYASACKKEEEKNLAAGPADAQQHVTAGVLEALDDKEKINFVFITMGNAVQLLASDERQDHGIPSTWILLDSQLTIDVFYNPQLVKNVRPT